MDFKIECPYCNRQYSVNESVIGQNVKCIVCAKEFTVRISNFTVPASGTNPTDYFTKKQEYTTESESFSFSKNKQQNNWEHPQEYPYPQTGYIPQTQSNMRLGNDMPQKPPNIQQPVYMQIHYVQKSRSIYVMLGLFFGTLGVHDFYAGDTGRGVTHFFLALLVAGCFVAADSLFVELFKNQFVYFDISAFILLGKIIGLVNLFWALGEIIFIKKDGKGIPME